MERARCAGYSEHDAFRFGAGSAVVREQRAPLRDVAVHAHRREPGKLPFKLLISLPTNEAMKFRLLQFSILLCALFV